MVIAQTHNLSRCPSQSETIHGIPCHGTLLSNKKEQTNDICNILGIWVGAGRAKGLHNVMDPLMPQFQNDRDVKVEVRLVAGRV